MSGHLSHIDDAGDARMVDISAKSKTARVAVAQGFVSMSAVTLEAVRQGNIKKGDVVSVARIAGIMAAKRTHELIPLCHPIALTNILVDFTFEADGLAITSTVKTTDRTGVEMEALTAVSVAALTIYDMCKAIDKAITIEGVSLRSKSGGKSGDWKR
ncbi:MAG: cyclic pyranopterin monophosphate synthase MoaC [Actinomycetota bacterium]